MKELIKRLMPSSFEDIIALVALFRPGPLRTGMDKEFIDRKHGRAKVEYLHPDLKSVLSDTYGVILYQEQVMQIAQVLANYTLGGADILRKAMGKKDEKEMAKQRQTFIKGAEQNGISEKLSGSIFNLMETFAEYGFNKSHSAAYALVSYQTAWLKAHFPAHFMAAVLSADMQNTDKIVTHIDECRTLNLSIVPPDVNIGQFNFTVNDSGAIVYGLGAIKGLGEGPVQIISAARAEGRFQNILDLCQRLDPKTVNKRTLEALVRSGALDCLIEGNLDQSRAQLSFMLPSAMRAADQSNQNLASGAQDLFGTIEPVEPNINLAPSRGRDLSWGMEERLSAEKDTLGLYFSGHPIDECLQELSKITKNRLVDLRPERGAQLVAGLLHGLRTNRSTKSGEIIAFLTLDDKTGRIEVSIYSELYERNYDVLHKDAVVMIKGSTIVDDFTDNLKMRATNVLSVEQARVRLAKKLKLNIDQSGLDPDFSRELAAILTPFKELNGEGCPVVVKYCRSDASVEVVFGDKWRVRPSDELMHDLRNRYGSRRVNLDY